MHSSQAESSFLTSPWSVPLVFKPAKCTLVSHTQDGDSTARPLGRVVQPVSSHPPLCPLLGVQCQSNCFSSLPACLLARLLPVSVFSENWSMLLIFECVHAGWRRQCYPTPVLLPGKSHGWRSPGGR